MRNKKVIMALFLLFLKGSLAGQAQVNSIRGDVNQDGDVNISDVTSLIDYLLSGSWPDNPVAETFTVNGVSFTMLPVQGGTFTMGATSEQAAVVYSPDENPTHQVTLSGFCIGETEVTQALWQAVMGSNPSKFTGNQNLPVEQVTWNDCQIFITKLNEITGRNFRLPTEAEWEYAARGGKLSRGYVYSGSNMISSVAWYYENSGQGYSGNADYGTHSVASKHQNELGLYDMCGNVAEWCSDWYASTYNSEHQTNPSGPETGTSHVVRGGSWMSEYYMCRVASRDRIQPSVKWDDLGLRIVL